MTIQSRVPWDDYLALPGASISRLKELKRSPLHYKFRLTNPKETTSLSLGKAAHCAVLEPERFSHDYAVWDRRTESGNMAPRNGKWWDAFKDANAGKSIITEDEAATAMAIQAAVRSNPDAMRYLTAGDPEVTMQWMLGDLRCKGRADWLTFIDDEPVIVGLKTSRDCRPFPFGSQAAKLSYHLQWAYYHDGFESITQRTPKMVEIVVENEAPHAVVVYVIPEDVILQGRDEYLLLLELLATCESTGTWDGPAIGEQTLTLPSWVYQSQDDISELNLDMGE
jgi:hypothetical protein